MICRSLTRDGGNPHGNRKGTPVLWYDTIGHIPIRVGIPIVLTAPEAKAALEEFVGFLAELAAVPDADKMTFGEAYKLAIEERDKSGRLT